MKTFEKAMRKHLQEVEALEDKNNNLLLENSYLKRDEEELRKTVSSQAELIRKISKERDDLKKACNALEFALDATQESLSKVTADLESLRKFREESLKAMSTGLANAKKEIEAKDREIAKLKIPDEVRTCEAIRNLETELEKTGQPLSEIERKEAIEDILDASQAQNSYYERELLRAEGMLKSEQARSRRLVWIMRKETEQHRRLLDILSAASCYGNTKLETIKGIISSLEMQKDEELGD